MRQFETTKLFYDQYKYKIVMINVLGHLFKKPKMALAQRVLDSLQQMHNDNKPIVLETGYRKYAISPEVFLESKMLHRALLDNTSYKIRCERAITTIYSNNLAWLRTLLTNANSPLELWIPAKHTEKILEEPNVIITKTPNEFEYKLTLSSTRKTEPMLANWIRANPDKVKATDRCLSLIDRGGFPNGQFIHVRDKKVLQLISVMFEKIGRIDKLVYVTDEDK